LTVGGIHGGAFLIISLGMRGQGDAEQCQQSERFERRERAPAGGCCGVIYHRESPFGEESVYGYCFGARFTRRARGWQSDSAWRSDLPVEQSFGGGRLETRSPNLATLLAS
jgi:hypothetical protein